jgi:hypothetical protein
MNIPRIHRFSGKQTIACYIALTFCATALYTTGCVTTGTATEPATVQLSPAEMGSLQVRTFDAPEATVEQAVLDVLMDRGYQIKSSGGGVINAETAPSFKPVIWTTQMVQQQLATIRTEAASSSTRVRLSLMQRNQKVMGVVHDMSTIPAKAVTDESVYSSFFADIAAKLR